MYHLLFLCNSLSDSTLSLSGLHPADSLFSGLGLGPVVGLGLVGLLLVLVVVDVSCYFLRQCGLLMCITRKLCSKKTTTSGKSKEMEEGKAAYL